VVPICTGADLPLEPLSASGEMSDITSKEIGDGGLYWLLSFRKPYLLISWPRGDSHGG
jgi:hypothetical protein